jgi:hypothetical protein
MSAPTLVPPIDEAKLNEFMGKAVADMGAAIHAVIILLGDRLGLYKAMADCEPVSPAELARRTGLHERYVREWLHANAASGYVTYDAAAKTFTLPPEQALALAVEDSPVYLPGVFQILSACYHDAPKIEAAFRTGQGVGWHEHHHDLFRGTERFFRPNYNANLITSWIPSLDGMEERLRRGAKVADVGCGLGASTILMAKEYANSTFYGFDYHAGSSSWRGKPRKSPESRTASNSRWLPPRVFRVRTTTSSPFSTVCTIWAIRPERPRTFARPFSPKAPG